MAGTGFGLRNHWYALVQSTELKGDEPYGIKLLGEPLVLWRDKEQIAHCYVDKCPHRSAQLSVGSIVDGKLECKYHGWQFEKEGQCVVIPSVAPEKSIGRGFCATSYHTVEKWELVWVFMGDQSLAATTPLPSHLFAEYDNRAVYSTTRGFRDFDIDHGLMIENLLDPAHLPFTHVGTLATRDHAEELAFTILYDNVFDKSTSRESNLLFPEGAYGFQGEVYPKKRNKQGFTFQAPCIVRIDLPTKKGKKLIQLLFCIPITPTKMRLNYIFVRDFAKFLNYMPGTNRIFQWSSDKVTDQDLELLAGQQLNLRVGAAEFNTAVSADKMGVRYRRWRNISEANDNAWFSGFSQEHDGVADIEDLVTTAGTTKPPRTSKRPTQTDLAETNGNGGKNFKPRPRISLLAPKVKWYALSLLGVSVLALVIVNKFLRRS